MESLCRRCERSAYGHYMEPDGEMVCPDDIF